ncbi:MAG TPA: ABC transporter substrate-binding protein [Stellaceae bacterium]|nr:ABC transporter substrate-binding protein [Stellaceae bacterium]
MAKIPQEILRELAPSGRLRAAINFGNPVLAQKDTATGEPAGVSAALARELARRLGVAVEFVTFTAAGAVVEALKAEAWDICFLAIDPLRAAGIDFTAPYVMIEGTYVVPSSSELRRIEDVDRDGVRIVVEQASAYDLFLTRALKHASLVRNQSGGRAVEIFLQDRLEALAGVKQPLVAFAQAHPDMRVIPGRFMVINQAMGTPKGHAAGARYLRSFVEEMKSSGFVARELARSGQDASAAAPPAASA